MDLQWLSLPGRFISRLVYTEPPQFVNYISGFPTWHWFPQRFLLLGFALISCDSLYLPVCLSNYGESGLPCDITSLTDPRRVVDFSVWSAFYLSFRTQWQLPSSLHAGLEVLLWFLLCGFTVKLSHLYIVHTFSPDWPRIAIATSRTGKTIF